MTIKELFVMAFSKYKADNRLTLLAHEKVIEALERLEHLEHLESDNEALEMWNDLYVKDNIKLKKNNTELLEINQQLGLEKEQLSNDVKLYQAELDQLKLEIYKLNHVIEEQDKLLKEESGNV